MWFDYEALDFINPSRKQLISDQLTKQFTFTFTPGQAIHLYVSKPVFYLDWTFCIFFSLINYMWCMFRIYPTSRSKVKNAQRGQFTIKGLTNCNLVGSIDICSLYFLPSVIVHFAICMGAFSHLKVYLFDHVYLTSFVNLLFSPNCKRAKYL